MKIEGSNILLSGQRILKESYVKKESLRVWIGNEMPDSNGISRTTSLSTSSPQVQIHISKSARSLRVSDVDNTTEESILTPEDRVKKALIEKMLEALTGKKIKIRIYPMPKADNGSLNISAPSILTNSSTEGRQGWGIEYALKESYIEQESITFNAKGIIRTADGKDISIDINLAMSREFLTQNNINLREGDAKIIDPLIINFDGTGVKLTDTMFSFDLDSDGLTEDIPFVSSGSAFLAIDKNNDGIINNGIELFGTESGNGFIDLSKYDEDKNYWIDESDPIFSKLRLWVKDLSGNDYLLTLKDKDIGAIYLANMATQFNIKDEQNKLRAQIANTGIYLKEGGDSGIVQQVNLTV